MGADRLLGDRIQVRGPRLPSSSSKVVVAQEGDWLVEELFEAQLVLRQVVLNRISILKPCCTSKPFLQLDLG